MKRDGCCQIKKQIRPRSHNLKLVLILLLALYILSPASTYAADLKGEIRAIEVEGLTRIREEELIDIICFHPGDLIDRENLKAGIKRAFKKGFFLDIEVVSEPYDSGIKLKYIVKEIPVIKHINIEGNKRISKRNIKRALIFKEGEAFKEDILDKAKSELEYFFYRKGFPDARVQAGIEKNDIKGLVDIHLQIEENAPLIIKKIQMPLEVKHRMMISEGEIMDLDQVDKDIRRLKEYYKKREYLRPIIGPYEFKEGVLKIPVVPGPKIDIVFKGNRVFGSKRLEREVPFFEDEEVTFDLLREAVERIKSLYQKKGYYYVQVSGGIETEEHLVRVIFFIFEGKRVFVREIKFEGTIIPHEAIKEIIPLKEKRPFQKDLLDICKETIIDFYNALGYHYADVSEMREDFLGDDSELNLTFQVYQGPLIKIGEITITGNEAVSTDEIKKVLQIELGDPYNNVDIGDARYRILSVYSRFGYVNAAVEVESSVDLDLASVTFRITEHEPFVFGKIVISGNRKTKDKIIKREFDIKEGEPYNYEAIFSTRQRLYKLGLFSDVSIRPIETYDLRQDMEEEVPVNRQDLVVNVKEGSTGAVEVGLGYGEFERLRGFFDISYRNLGGYNRQIGLRTELSSIEERYMLHYREPRLFNKPSLPLKVSLTKENIRSINLDTKDVLYKLDRLSLIAGVVREFTEHVKGSLNYEYSIVETSDVMPGVILSKEDTGTVGISSISPALFYDSRNNPFDPTSGSFRGIILKWASRIFFSESRFIKVILQSSSYHQIRKGLIFAFSLQSGIAHRFGDTAELPLVERFFLGGRTTVRGYDHDTLGPKGEDGNPTGGNIFALANGELRISLRKNFGFVAFVDSGNVWHEVRDVEPVLRYTTGIGLRYNTPVGPLRIDYGYKLNRKDGESAGEVHFSVGHAF